LCVVLREALVEFDNQNIDILLLVLKHACLHVVGLAALQVDLHLFAPRNRTVDDVVAVVIRA
jgi:hypothetical protein